MVSHIVETDRLILRRWFEKDHMPFASMCADPDVMRYIGDGSIRTATQTSEAISKFEAEWATKGYGLFAVELKQTSDLIGFTGFACPDFLPEVQPAIEIGWRFAKSHWGRGYASEAATAALSFGIDELGLTDVVSIYQIENRASERIMQKLGMVFDRKTVDSSCGREIAVYRLPR